ncbi:hypothetical protein CBR_g40159 [Chara braunii]|uniref:Protein kinase domain-containing protein n=1 Tax=Chara braunii TaxID=69332 RepID=A0A388LTC4_CHABU|nr:hypothetical protein CBR_g40159 [Chara braunii]|eukprot:GBG85521.1 hypothetical protein CBR_g40159 [Chara braunii]
MDDKQADRKGDGQTDDEIDRWKDRQTDRQAYDETEGDVGIRKGVKMAMVREGIATRGKSLERVITACRMPLLVVSFMTIVMLSLAVGDIRADSPFINWKNLFANTRFQITSNTNESYVVRGIAAGADRYFLSMCKYNLSRSDGTFRKVNFQPDPQSPASWCKVIIYSRSRSDFTSDEIGNVSQTGSSASNTLKNPTSLALSSDESTLFVLDNAADTLYVADLAPSAIAVKPLLWFRGLASQVSVVYNVGTTPPGTSAPPQQQQILSKFSQMAYDRIGKIFYIKVNDYILIFPERGADGMPPANDSVTPNKWALQTSDMVGLALTPDGQYLFVSDVMSQKLFRCDTSRSTDPNYMCVDSLPDMSMPFLGRYMSLAVTSQGGCDLFASATGDGPDVWVYHLKFAKGPGIAPSDQPKPTAKSFGFPAILALAPNDTELLVADFSQEGFSTVYSLVINQSDVNCAPAGTIAPPPPEQDKNTKNAEPGITPGGGVSTMGEDRKREGTNVGLIVGLVVGGISVGLLVIAVWHRTCGVGRPNRKHRALVATGDSEGFTSSAFGGQTASEYGWTAHTTMDSVSVDSKKAKGAASSGSERRSIPGLTHYAYETLRDATGDFTPDNKIGTPGAFGQVYKGVLDGGKEVAIKVMKGHLTAGKYQQFQAEVALQGDLNHVHVCKLLGFCEAPKGAGQELLLVYPYIKSGSLYDNLHAKEDVKAAVSLDVQARITIALHVAKGLRYLHEEADRPVYHRDVKSHNILLDMPAGPQSLCAKLADFGIAKMGETLFQPDRKGEVETTHLCGTQGYMAPEYVNAGIVGPKNDVHAFGVVLLELITGKKAVIEQPERQSLVSFVKPLLNQPSVLLRVIDSRLHIASTEGVKFQALHRVALIAANCTNPSPDERPSMGNIVNELEVISASLSSS